MSDWNAILDVARATPSPHNVQPWRCRVLSDQRLLLLLDRRRMLPETDRTGSFMHTAMGMFIEACTIAAANLGRRLDHRILPETEQQPLMPFAELTLHDTPAPPAPYSNALLLRRRTSRLAYERTPVAPQAVSALEQLASAWGQRLVVVRKRATIEDVMRENIRALFYDLNDPVYAGELVPWFRFSQRQALHRRDGLDFRCMRLTRLEFVLAARAPQLMQLPVASTLLRRLYRQRLGYVPAIGALAGTFWDRTSAIHAGRFLFRFWLELEQHGLSMHPLGNLVTNTRSAAWIRTTLDTDQIWLMFKLGSSQEPPVSQRLTLTEVLRD